MDNQVSKSQFRAKLLEYLRRVAQDQRTLIVTHNGRPVVKVSPYNENSESILASLRYTVVFYQHPADPVA